VLVGHSLGGAAVLGAAHRIPESVAVATIGAPADPQHVLRLLGSAAEEIEQHGRAEVSIGGRPFMIAKPFLDQFQSHDQAEAIRNLDRALMIFHAPLDDIVGIENAAEIFELARHPKSFVSLDTADHLLRRPADASYVAEVIAAWASRYSGERRP
jgi:putative redox protein